MVKAPLQRGQRGDITQIFGGPSAEALEPAQRTRLDIARAAFGELVKLVKNIQLYGGDHQANAKFRERLFDAMSRMLDGQDALEIGIGPYEFTLYSQTIYENHSVERNFVYRFFMDGVRALTFEPGLSRAELDGLVDILLLDWDDPAYFEDDVVTMLWEKQFTNIEHRIAQGYDDDAPDGEAHHYTIEGVIAKVRERAAVQVAQGAAAKHRRSQVIHPNVGLTDANLVQFREHPFAMDEAEFRTLGGVIRTTGRETLEKFIEILFKVSADVGADDGGARVAQLFSRIADLQLDGGQLGELERLMRKVRRLERATPDTDLIEGIFSAWSTPAFVGRVMRGLNDEQSVQTPSVLAVLGLLDGSLMPHICRQIGSIRVERNRTALIERLPMWLAETRTALIVARMLNEVDAALAHDLLAVFKTQSTEVLQAAVRAGMQNPQAKVRLECLASFGTAEIQQFRDLLFGALTDSAKTVRSRALQALTRVRDPDVHTRILQSVEAKAFGKYDLDEKRRYFVAAALTGDPTAQFISLLGETGLLSRSRIHEEARHCAAVALAVRLSPDVRPLFEKELGRRFKSEIVHEACAWGLGHMALEQKARTQQLYDLFYQGSLAGGSA
ncbi:MAG: hypothetical protein ACI9U2_000044 [Bradymonadia bacterium]|jgi:hypothetical protein